MLRLLPLLAILLAGIVSWPDVSRAQQPTGGQLRIGLQTDLVRWVRFKAESDLLSPQRATYIGPAATPVGSVTGLASLLVGYAATDAVVVNAEFGLSRTSIDAGEVDDFTALSLRLLPDVDLIVHRGRVLPYLTVGLPVYLLKVRRGSSLRARSFGPQGGFGLMAGPFHVEGTLGFLFGSADFEVVSFDGSYSETANVRAKELTFGVTLGGSLWH